MFDCPVLLARVEALCARAAPAHSSRATASRHAAARTCARSCRDRTGGGGQGQYAFPDLARRPWLCRLRATVVVSAPPGTASASQTTTSHPIDGNYRQGKVSLLCSNRVLPCLFHKSLQPCCRKHPARRREARSGAAAHRRLGRLEEEAVTIRATRSGKRSPVRAHLHAQRGPSCASAPRSTSTPCSRIAVGGPSPGAAPCLHEGRQTFDRDIHWTYYSGFSDRHTALGGTRNRHPGPCAAGHSDQARCETRPPIGTEATASGRPHGTKGLETGVHIRHRRGFDWQNRLAHWMASP